MSKRAAELQSSYGRKLAGLKKVRASAEKAFSKGAIRATDRDHIYESTFLDAVSLFETFQEELFFSAILRRSGINGVRPLVAFRNRAEAEKIVLGAARRGYVSWSQMKENIDRAHAYLSGGRPFSRLLRRGRDLAVLETITRIRNAIAHESGTAWERFRKLPMGTLPAARRTPAGYLQSLTGTTSQHEALLTELERLSRVLTAESDKAARSLLRDEDPYQSFHEVSRGRYECVTCRATTILSSPAQLPVCVNCNQGACPYCGTTKRNTFRRLY